MIVGSSNYDFLAALSSCHSASVPVSITHHVICSKTLPVGMGQVIPVVRQYTPMTRDKEYNEADIVTITPVEAVRKRPEMYFRTLNETVQGIENQIISEGYQCHSDVHGDSGDVLIESHGYKYHAIKKLLNDKYASNIVNDVITLYSGGSFGNGRCLVGYGFILNAVSSEFSIHAWDGMNFFDITFVHGVQSFESVPESDFKGLRIHASIHHDFTHFIQGGIA